MVVITNENICIFRKERKNEGIVLKSRIFYSGLRGISKSMEDETNFMIHLNSKRNIYLSYREYSNILILLGEIRSFNLLKTSTLRLL